MDLILKLNELSEFKRSPRELETFPPSLWLFTLSGTKASPVDQKEKSKC